MEEKNLNANYRILLVDDDKFILSGVTRVLEKEGYDVVKADSGEKALIFLQNESFDLVLTDLVMGQVGGVEVLMETKRVQPETMVIILTGYADMKAAVNAIKFGADDFMIKPAESEEIYFRVQKCMENKVLRSKIRQHTVELERVNEQLRLDIIERTKTEEELNNANTELNDSLKKLTFAQDKLVQSEKLAALGGLVAGVTHEINTPIGIGITASSFILQQISKVKSQTERLGIDDEDLVRITETIRESASMISSSLGRAGELVSDFKQVSVDQESEKPRSVIVCDYIYDVLSSLSLEYKSSGHKIEVTCTEGLVFNSRPGALAQILTNFVMNAMIHAFDGIDSGCVTIDVSSKAGMMFLHCSDNGSGMETTSLKQIFDPFYTTRRDEGGSGLGMYVVYSLVTKALNGSIECESEPGKGTTFSICVPLNNLGDDTGQIP